MAQAGLLSGLEHHSIHQMARGSIPGQGTYLGCVFDPPQGYVQEATDRCSSLTSIFLSLSFSLPPPLSKDK